MSLNNIMRAVFATIGFCVILSLYAVIQLRGLSDEVDTMSDIQYLSYQAADELRQSSDDLTRLGRTYVITGDAKYEKMYMDILDIRNGKKPRPENYHTIYWDLVLEYGQKPKSDGSSQALLDRMKSLGFVESELALLAEAAANSDALVAMEVKAMNAVKGLYPDGNGQYTIQGTPDQKLAIDLLHGNQYHIEKAKIVTPIDTFFSNLESRTRQQLEDASASVKTIVLISSITMLLVLITAAIGYLIVSKSITGRIIGMADRLAKSADTSDLTLRVDTQGSNEISEMGKGINKFLASYCDTVLKINEVNSTIKSISSTIGEISYENIELSQQQTQEMEMAAAAMKEMTTTLASVSENTSNAEIHAASTETAANSGKDTFEKTNSEFEILESEFEQTTTAISELANETENVGNVLDVIKGIAEQTNLLALNAAIEAARAGEQGRGFAVVADEVRSLAQRTQESTIEIEIMVSSLQQKASQSTVKIKKIADRIGVTNGNIANAGEALSTIQMSASEIHHQNTAIAAATEEQLVVSGEISRNLENVQSISSDIAAKIQQLRPAVVNMEGSVEDLRATVAHLTVE